MDRFTTQFIDGNTISEKTLPQAIKKGTLLRRSLRVMCGQNICLCRLRSVSVLTDPEPDMEKSALEPRGKMEGVVYPIRVVHVADQTTEFLNTFWGSSRLTNN